MSAGDLAEVQQDLQGVKKALRDGSSYLGMSGDTLTKYLLQLNEKENLLYSAQLKHMSNIMSVGGDSAVSSMGNGLGALPRAVQVPTVPAREPPSGPTKVYNKEDIAEILNHMAEYEAVPVEGAKALRALSSLAYSNAGRVGGDARVLPQLLRVLALHPEEQQVRIGAMRVVCNMAYDNAVSTNQLTDLGVLSALLATLPEVDDAAKGNADKAKGGEAAAKAGEALARIVAAEVNPEGNGTVKMSASAEGSLARVFFAAANGEAAWQNRVPQLVKQLVANEVCEPRDIADRFVVLSKLCSGTATAGTGWMSLSKLLAAMESTIPTLPQCMVDAGAIRVAVQIMDAQDGEAAVQLAGVEAMSALVGNRWAGLLAFAEAGGMKRIEAALSTHVDNFTLQTKGIRALASGIGWPEDVQKKAGYDARESLGITIAAMQRHGDQQELLTAGLEAVSKYLNKFPVAKDQVVQAGGAVLVQGIMRSYTEVKQIQDLGSAVCARIGA